MANNIKQIDYVAYLNEKRSKYFSSKSRTRNPENYLEAINIFTGSFEAEMNSRHIGKDFQKLLVDEKSFQKLEDTSNRLIKELEDWLDNRRVVNEKLEKTFQGITEFTHSIVDKIEENWKTQINSEKNKENTKKAEVKTRGRKNDIRVKPIPEEFTKDKLEKYIFENIDGISHKGQSINDKINIILKAIKDDGLKWTNSGSINNKSSVFNMVSNELRGMYNEQKYYDFNSLAKKPERKNSKKQFKRTNNTKRRGLKQ